MTPKDFVTKTVEGIAENYPAPGDGLAVLSSMVVFYVMTELSLTKERAIDYFINNMVPGMAGALEEQPEYRFGKRNYNA